MACSLMFQGTGSDVGKSLVVAGLCRLFTRRGLVVRPFKPQNMSNNAAVTIDGGEIGRAQALQARACKVAPHTDMNPVLLKPQSDVGAQIVLQGKVYGNASAQEYHTFKATLLPTVLESFTRLNQIADLVLVEGAGSTAEINLRELDIANMGFAEAANLPVVLVADIDRGGVLASIVGTHILLSKTERARLIGYIINKFRGDLRLFDPAIDIIKTRTGLSCLGVIPWFEQAMWLPKEDTVALHQTQSEFHHDTVKVIVPRLPHIANFDDLDPLVSESDISVNFIEPGNPLPSDADLIVIPGSKATLTDLAFVRTQGWDIDIIAHVRRGGVVVGICGGYQMLGTRISDPAGREGKPSEAEGLGLLNVETIICNDKKLNEVHGVDAIWGKIVQGYEMHMGITSGPDLQRPWIYLDGQRPEGACNTSGHILGCYMHGLFSADGFRHAFFKALKPNCRAHKHYEIKIEEILDALADHLETCLDINQLLEAAI